MMEIWRNLSGDVQILLMLALFYLPVWLMQGVYVWQDSKTRPVASGMWTAIALLVPGMMGFLVYLLIRPPRQKDSQAPEMSLGMVYGGLIGIFLLSAVLVFVGTFGGDAAYPTLFFTRYQTDLTMVESFVDPAALEEDLWTSYTRTNADGSRVEVWQDQNMTRDSYQIRRVDSQGNQEQECWGIGRGTFYGIVYDGFTWREYTSDSLPGAFLVRGKYSRDDQGRIVYIKLEKGGDTAYKTTTVATLLLEYDSQGQLAAQTLEGEEPQSLSYAYDQEGRLSRVEWYAGEMLLGYAEYTWSRNGALRIGQTFDSEGNVLGSELLWQNERGQTLRQECYDAEGAFLYQVEFAYDPLGILDQTVTVQLAAGLWMALVVYTGCVMVVIRKEKNPMPTEKESKENGE